MIEEGSQALLYFGLKAFLLEKYPGMIFYLGRSAYGESSPFPLEKALLSFCKAILYFWSKAHFPWSSAFP
jgi:hypothetical protein